MSAQKHREDRDTKPARVKIPIRERRRMMHRVDCDHLTAEHSQIVPYRVAKHHSKCHFRPAPCLKTVLEGRK